MKESIVGDAGLWASCIVGDAQQDAYRAAIEGAGLRIESIRDNPTNSSSSHCACGEPTTQPAPPLIRMHSVLITSGRALW